MNWERKRVLITGVSGFAGSYLAKKLYELGADVYGLIRKRADWSKPKNLVDKGIIDKINLIEGDLLDITSLANALDISQPEVIFHFASQSYVPNSFRYPLDTQQINCIGTANLLESIRIKDYDPVVVFAGSSEEYGLVISSEKQYDHVKKKYNVIFPEPEKIPEVPISEKNPLRPMSPYGVSRVYGDYIMRDYYFAYGIKTIISRAFNHEGAGRGKRFVTSVITRQVMQLKMNEVDRIVIGNVNAFRDWSHVKDIVNGYILLAEKGKYGDVYNQGSMRTNSVLTYLLLSLEEAGWKIRTIRTIKGDKVIENPTEIIYDEMFGIRFRRTKIDEMMLKGDVEFDASDKGIIVQTQRGNVNVEFDPERFRPAEVPILLSDCRKAQTIGFKISYEVQDIIRDQLNYFLSAENRK